MKKCLILGLCLCLCGNVLRVQGEADNFNKEDIYSITPEDEEWSQLTIQQKYDVCRIPNRILDVMSNEELIQSILDYPFLNDVFLYSSFEEGVEAIEQVCDAYVELLSRNEGKESIVRSLNQRNNVLSREYDILEQIKSDALSILVAYQDDFELTNDEIKVVDAVSELINYEYIDNVISTINNSKAYTPKGNWVGDIATYCEHNEQWHINEAQQTAQCYDVTYVSTGSCHYNCHSYAWYSQSPSNHLWIPNPSLYMTDGSYNRVYSPIGGDRIFYGTNSLPSHSGIITMTENGAIMVASKWGLSGVFIHTIYNVPNNYDTANISYWRLP